MKEFSFSTWPYIPFLCYVTIRNVLIWQCDPYFDEIGCSHPGCEPAYPTPTCVRKCVNGNQLWRESKHYSVSAYRVNSDPYDIMAEVYKNGPVEVSFTVYEVSESLIRLLYSSVLQLIFYLKNVSYFT